MSAGEQAPAAAPAATPVEILGVRYWHVKTDDEGDLYATAFGRPFLEDLLPRNWYARDWFEANRERLEGTSTVYKVTTRPRNGRSLSLVVKWCRVGEQVPFDTMTLNRFSEAEFNSPYEEFARVLEMRAESGGPRVRTHRPLAIYVPAERLKLWQTGRSRSKIAQKKAKHRDVELDIYRQYILIYEWVEGETIAEALARTALAPERRAQAVDAQTQRATGELAAKGFRVLDMKPAHIIVRNRPGGTLLRLRSGEPAYALVDFELLERTPEHEREVVHARRSAYLRKQRDRFGAAPSATFPPNLHPVRVLDTDYVYGPTESTNGALWVVGSEPGLFDYFQPERWRRTPRTSLSATNEVYYTRTKDDINLVWRVSRVGERPEVAAASADGLPPPALRYGYNSPFQEFAFALALASRGVPTVYPRAIYMSGLESERPEYVEDPVRYGTHARWRTPEGAPVLRPDHTYVTVWGYWNGLDEMLANQDREHCRPVNLAVACNGGYVSRADAPALVALMRERLAAAGFADLNLKEDHVLLSLSPDGVLWRDADGRPDVRVCNFELMAPRRDALPVEAR